MRIRHALLPIAVAFVTACASAPPPMGELANAEAAIAVAAEAGAADFAPVEFGFAEDKQRAARAALDARDYPAARRLALQAEADAALAAAKSHAAAGRNEVQKKSAENAALRRELLDGGPR